MSREIPVSVVATGPGDAWALGQPNFWSGGPGCGADVKHWNGVAWRRVPVPRNVFLGYLLADPLAASSASDAWIFPTLHPHRWLVFRLQLRAEVERDGPARVQLPGKLILQAAADPSPRDVSA